MSNVLLGGAIGDALGQPFEMMKFDNPKLTEWDGKTYLATPPRPKSWIGGILEPGQFTDDTQMSLMVAESLIKNSGYNPDDMSARYVDWIVSGRARGYGRTTALAVKRLQEGTHWSESGVEGSYGNGTAMRAAPFGVYFRNDIKSLIKALKTDSAITHRSEDAEAGALAIGLASYFAANQDTKDMLPKIVEYLPDCETKTKIVGLADMKKMDLPAHYVLFILGTGADVKETVPAALFLFEKCANYEQAVVSAIRAGGDTDTTAAIVGSLFGAKDGTKDIPTEWVTGIEDRENLLILDSQLYNRSNTNFFSINSNGK